MNDAGERRQAYYAMAVILVDEGNCEAGLEQIDNAMAQAETNGDKGSMAFDALAKGYLCYEMGRPMRQLPSSNAPMLRSRNPKFLMEPKR
jgi:hypothetical protein